MPITAPTAAPPLWQRQRSRLIEEYVGLQNLEGGITPQVRGQRFNKFLADLLESHEIRAHPNIQTDSSGEIDVAFELDGKRFVLEAKWESSTIDEGPITKLKDRVEKRLGGTIGILASMSSFTRPALTGIRIGRQLQIILLTKEHIEAMIYGFLTPSELINAVLDNAHFRGEPLTPLACLTSEIPGKLPFSFANFETAEGIEIINTEYGILPLAKTTATSVHETNSGELILRTKNATVTVSPEQNSHSIKIGIPNLEDFYVDNNIYTMLRNKIVAIYDGDSWSFNPRFVSINLSLVKMLSSTMVVVRNKFPEDNESPELVNLRSGNSTKFPLEGSLISSIDGVLFNMCRDQHSNKVINRFDEYGTRTANCLIPIDLTKAFLPVTTTAMLLVLDKELHIFNIETGKVKLVLKSERPLSNLVYSSTTGECIFGVFNQHDTEFSGLCTELFRLEKISII